MSERKPVSMKLTPESQLAYQRYRHILQNGRVTIKSAHRNPDGVVIVYAEERDGNAVRENAYFFACNRVRPLVARGRFHKLDA